MTNIEAAGTAGAGETCNDYLAADEVRGLELAYCESVLRGSTGWGVPFTDWVALTGRAVHVGNGRLVRPRPGKMSDSMLVPRKYFRSRVIRIFDYPRQFTTLSDYSAHRGWPVTVLGPVHREVLDYEGDGMYVVMADDGWLGHAFYSELRKPETEVEFSPRDPGAVYIVEHPVFTLTAWMDAVWDSETRLGYAHWAAHRHAMEQAGYGRGEA